MRVAAFFSVVLLLPLVTLASPDGEPLVIHEWGTFTSLQDEAGRSVGGVNIDDEPLPKFVHRLGQPRPGDDPLSVFAGKSLYPGHASVTMRLETPVIYFYPPNDKPITLDVTATFNGGVLSEFYPDGQTTLDGKPSQRAPESVNARMRGGITWKNVVLNSPATQPTTDAHVWLAPRQVPAASPIGVGAEGEKYIFYRGAGQFDAPLKVTRNGSGDAITIAPQAGSKHDLAPMPMWLAEFRGDGSAAFRRVALGDHAATFGDADYRADNVARLRAAMKQALVSDGLFEDEAEAMLETWKASYFKTPGQRLFFLVPKGWTDEVLPLEVSAPAAKVTRVMIGRIELITPQQRVALDRLADEHAKPDKETTAALTATLGRFAVPLIQDAKRQRARAAQLGAAQ